jgi:hypothetical protein
LYQSWFGAKVMVVSVFGDNHFIDEITFDALLERENDQLLIDSVAIYRRCAISIVEDAVVLVNFIVV